MPVPSLDETSLCHPKTFKSHDGRVGCCFFLAYINVRRVVVRGFSFKLWRIHS